MAKRAYTGAVCYLDGWHHTVTKDANGDDTPGERLVLEDDGTYRPATEQDLSWHDRKHTSFTLVVPDGGKPAVAVTADEMAAIQSMLDERRAG